MTDDECPVCNDYILPGDLRIDIWASDVKEDGMENQVSETTNLHAACFMDLVKIGDVRGGKISRTKIMEGRVKRKQDEDNNYYLEVVEEDDN